MPCHTRMKIILLRGLLWLYLLGFGFIVTSLEPGFLDFDNLPDTNFTCVGKVIGGYYADLETSCQMFHVCTIGQLDEPMDIRFLCLNGTVFDQETRVCERIDEVDCSKSEQFYSLNLELYGNTQPPILEDTSDSDSDTELPEIFKQPSTTTTTTTTPRPTKPKTNRPSFIITTTPKPPSTTLEEKLLQPHPFQPTNSADIRFNPEEINISLNPGAPPDIRPKPISFQQSISENNKRVIVTTHSTIYKNDVPKQPSILSTIVPPTTQRVKQLYESDGYSYNEGYHNTEKDDYQTEQPTFQFRPSNFRPSDFYKSSTYRYQPTIKPINYNTNHRGPTTYRTHPFVASLKPSQQYYHHHTEKPPRIQLPLPLLPTLSPLTFSSPAPFTLNRHVETKRYTDHHQAPRIVISASASVSDATGRKFNYSLGTIGDTRFFSPAPTTYDDYKEDDVGLDPFYHDVPKLRRLKRQADVNPEREAIDVIKFLFNWYNNYERTTKINVPVLSETITEINDELTPIQPQNENARNLQILKPPPRVSEGIISVTENVQPVETSTENNYSYPVYDYVDDNYEGDIKLVSPDYIAFAADAKKKLEGASTTKKLILDHEGFSTINIGQVATEKYDKVLKILGITTSKPKTTNGVVAEITEAATIPTRTTLDAYSDDGDATYGTTWGSDVSKDNEYYKSTRSKSGTTMKSWTNELSRSTAIESYDDRNEDFLGSTSSPAEDKESSLEKHSNNQYLEDSTFKQITKETRITTEEAEPPQNQLMVNISTSENVRAQVNSTKFQHFDSEDVVTPMNLREFQQTSVDDGTQLKSIQFQHIENITSAVDDKSILESEVASRSRSKSTRSRGRNSRNRQTITNSQREAEQNTRGRSRNSRNRQRGRKPQILDENYKNVDNSMEESIRSVAQNNKQQHESTGNKNRDDYINNSENAMHDKASPQSQSGNKNVRSRGRSFLKLHQEEHQAVENLQQGSSEGYFETPDNRRNVQQSAAEVYETLSEVDNNSRTRSHNNRSRGRNQERHDNRQNKESSQNIRTKERKSYTNSPNAENSTEDVNRFTSDDGFRLQNTRNSVRNQEGSNRSNELKSTEEVDRNTSDMNRIGSQNMRNTERNQEEFKNGVTEENVTETVENKVTSEMDINSNRWLNMRNGGIYQSDRINEETSMEKVTASRNIPDFNIKNRNGNPSAHIITTENSGTGSDAFKIDYEDIATEQYPHIEESRDSNGEEKVNSAIETDKNSNIHQMSDENQKINIEKTISMDTQKVNNLKSIEENVEIDTSTNEQNSRTDTTKSYKEYESSRQYLDNIQSSTKSSIVTTKGNRGRSRSSNRRTDVTKSFRDYETSKQSLDLIQSSTKASLLTTRDVEGRARTFESTTESYITNVFTNFDTFGVQDENTGDGSNETNGSPTNLSSEEYITDSSYNSSSEEQINTTLESEGIISEHSNISLSVSKDENAAYSQENNESIGDDLKSSMLDSKESFGSYSQENVSDDPNSSQSISKETNKSYSQENIADDSNSSRTGSKDINVTYSQDNIETIGDNSNISRPISKEENGSKKNKVNISSESNRTHSEDNKDASSSEDETSYYDEDLYFKDKIIKHSRKSIKSNINRSENISEDSNSSDSGEDSSNSSNSEEMYDDNSYSKENIGKSNAKNNLDLHTSSLNLTDTTTAKNNISQNSSSSYSETKLESDTSRLNEQDMINEDSDKNISKVKDEIGENVNKSKAKINLKSNTSRLNEGDKIIEDADEYTRKTIDEISLNERNLIPKINLETNKSKNAQDTIIEVFDESTNSSKLSTKNKVQSDTNETNAQEKIIEDPNNKSHELLNSKSATDLNKVHEIINLNSDAMSTFSSSVQADDGSKNSLPLNSKNKLQSSDNSSVLIMTTFSNGSQGILDINENKELLTQTTISEIVNSDKSEITTSESPVEQTNKPPKKTRSRGRGRYRNRKTNWESINVQIKNYDKLEVPKKTTKAPSTTTTPEVHYDSSTLPSIDTTTIDYQTTYLTTTPYEETPTTVITTPYTLKTTEQTEPPTVISFTETQYPSTLQSDEIKYTKLGETTTNHPTSVETPLEETTNYKTEFYSTTNSLYTTVQLQKFLHEIEANTRSLSDARNMDDIIITPATTQEPLETTTTTTTLPRHRFAGTRKPSRRKPTITEEIVDVIKSQTTTSSEADTIKEFNINAYTANLAYRNMQNSATTPLSRHIPIKINRQHVDRNYIFNCFGKTINHFYSDPRDCRLFHYCTAGFTKTQLLDMKFVCDLGTYFDQDKLICTKDKPSRCAA